MIGIYSRYLSYIESLSSIFSWIKNLILFTFSFIHLYCIYPLNLRLKAYGLTDENDDMANYLILSLQTDQMIPAPKKTEADMQKMEERILDTMRQFNMTRLEMFQNIAVQCDDFIGFYREQSFGTDYYSWPKICGEIFYDVPIFTPFGTCFTTKMSIRLVLLVHFIINDLVHRIYVYTLTFFFQHKYNRGHTKNNCDDEDEPNIFKKC